MNKKVTKWIIMLLCTIFIWTGNMTTYAAETADPETSDLKQLELYQIDESYGDLDEAAMSISDSSSGTALSGVYRTNWDSYGDDYCYQNLSTTWQELYDEMNLYCTAYMNTCVDAKVLSVNGRFIYSPIRIHSFISSRMLCITIVKLYIWAYMILLRMEIPVPMLPCRCLTGWMHGCRRFKKNQLRMQRRRKHMISSANM